MAEAEKPRVKSAGRGEKPGWYRITFVAMAIIFAVAMVGSYMYPLFTAQRTAERGTIATVDYTIYDAADQPVITSDIDLYRQAQQKGEEVLLTPALTMPVGVTVNETAIIGIPVYGGGNLTFGLLGFELNDIGRSLTGMSPGATLMVPLDYAGNRLIINVTAAEFEGMTGYNFSGVHTGDRVWLGLTSRPTMGVGDEGGRNTQTPLRIARVVEKGGDFLLLEYGYSTVEVRLSNLQA